MAATIEWARSGKESGWNSDSDPARSVEDYAPAYELGRVSYQLYGGPFEIAERVGANDWLAT